MTLNMKIMEERAEAKRIGDLSRVVSTIRKLRNKLDDDEIMDTFNLAYSEYSSIIEMIDSNPDLTDEDIAVDILGYTD